MTPAALAWRTARRYRARTLLAVAGITVIGALNVDMLLLSRGLLVSLIQMINSVGFDVRVVGSEGLPTMRAAVPGAAKLAADIRRLPEVEEVALVRLDPATAIARDGSRRTVNLVGTTEPTARGAWTIVRGDNLTTGDDRPAKAGHYNRSVPLDVTRRLASVFNLNPGSRLDLVAELPGVRSALPPVACRVVGIADFSFEAADEYTIATTMAGFDRAHGDDARDEADVVLVASNPRAGADAAAAAIQRAHPGLRVFSNDQVIARFNRNRLAYFRQISLLLSLTTAVFAFLLVATLLTVSVNQRLGEMAALRALGISRRRVAAALLWESALLVAAGGLLALPAAALLASQLDRILRQMPGLPERLHFFAFEPRALVIHVALLCTTALAAAVYPIWIAARLPIAPTLRREVVS